MGQHAKLITRFKDFIKFNNIYLFNYMIIKYEEQFKINQTLNNKKTNKKIQQKTKLKDENEQKKKKRRQKRHNAVFFHKKDTIGP